MTLARHRYGDPLEVLIREESRTCKGCIFTATVFDKRICTKGRRYGARCKQYEEQGVDMLRRVRKEEVQATAWAKTGGVTVCLECWSRWMGASDRDLGIQSIKSLAGDGDGYGNVDTGQARRDNEIAEATDAMINSLRQQHRWAIFRRCGLSTVWNFPQLDYVVTAQQAEIELVEKLKRNVATRTLFD
jgi:hypothetical protein